MREEDFQRCIYIYSLYISSLSLSLSHYAKTPTPSPPASPSYRTFENCSPLEHPTSCLSCYLAKLVVFAFEQTCRIYVCMHVHISSMYMCTTSKVTKMLLGQTSTFTTYVIRLPIKFV